MDWWEYQVTQGFGPTNESLDSGYGGYAHFNKGIDFGVPAGTPVRSVVSGTVISAGDVGDGWGTRVWIQDAQGNTHNLGHLGSATVTVGQTVLAGQQVGISGNTGASTGPHVSYDVWDPAGNYFDPSAYIAQAPGANPVGASPPMTMDPLDAAIANAIGGTTQQPRAVGRTAEELIAAGGVQQGLDAIVHAGTLYNLRDDGKFYAGFTELRPPNTADDTRVYGQGELSSLPGFAGARQVGPNLIVDYTDGSSQVFTQKQGGWTAGSLKMPTEAANRFVTIPSSATSNPSTPFGGAPPTSQPAPNQWDAVGLFNKVTQGGAGQQFLNKLPSGHLTPQHSQLVSDVSANQYGNNEMILRSYGIDTSKAEWRDPVAVAAAAATLGARQKGLVDQGYDPTFAASLIQYENNSGITNPLSQQGMVNPYSGGQNIIAGNDGHTYSQAYYNQYGITG
jgi:hypothetical protein